MNYWITKLIQVSLIMTVFVIRTVATAIFAEAGMKSAKKTSVGWMDANE